MVTLSGGDNRCLAADNLRCGSQAPSSLSNVFSGFAGLPMTTIHSIANLKKMK